MKLPVLILHGWSDTSGSFRPLARFLREQGEDVREVFLADYLSMQDEITLQDLGFAMLRALRDGEGLSLDRHSFNVVVHSTGGLVVREFLRQFCRDEAGNPDPLRTPVRNLLMLAPANFGSPLARMGKSMVGRLFKGWKWDGAFETGKRVLDSLELGSPLTWELAEADLFDPSFPVFDPAHTRVTVMVGSNAYPGRMKKLAHENGSDGTVRVATASLNALRYRLDFADPERPSFEEIPRNCGEIALAVLDRDHSSITRDRKAQQAEWRRTVLDSLNVDEEGYGAHAAACHELTRETYARGRASGRSRALRKRFHEYMHVVFRVRDQYGHAVEDYFIEFYQQDDDPADSVMEKIHGEILEKVSINSLDSSYRSFLFDLTDLAEAARGTQGLPIDLSIVAARESADIGYRNPPDVASAGVRVFDGTSGRFFRPNQPVLVDVVIHRDPGGRVFRISKFD
jgi:pimeloyl-ACP methyl ester carboxylesterase